MLRAFVILPAKINSHLIPAVKDRIHVSVQLSILTFYRPMTNPTNHFDWQLQFLVTLTSVSNTQSWLTMIKNIFTDSQMSVTGYISAHGLVTIMLSLWVLGTNWAQSVCGALTRTQDSSYRAFFIILCSLTVALVKSHKQHSLSPTQKLHDMRILWSDQCFCCYWLNAFRL